MGPDHWMQMTNLVVVVGHAIYVAENFERPEDDASWALQEFQKGEPRFYIEHIAKGIEVAEQDSTSLLIFSGGQTRESAGPRTEAQSYWLLAEHFRWWEKHVVRSRTTTEEVARDSFENILFGICRFYECTRRYPQHFTVIGWGFKKERFDGHRIAISWPQDRFTYIGVNDPDNLASARYGEQKAITDFRADPFATDEGPGRLGEKRKKRNPFNRQHGYVHSCPAELVALLQHRSDRIPYPGPLPW